MLFTVRLIKYMYFIFFPGKFSIKCIFHYFHNLEMLVLIFSIFILSRIVKNMDNEILEQYDLSSWMISVIGK